MKDLYRRISKPTVKIFCSIPRSVFAFSTRKTALLEMSLKKANLEDVFIELTENDRKNSRLKDAPKQLKREKVRK